MSREASGVSPPSTVAASSGRRAQQPQSLPAPSGPRPFTSPPSHRNSQPPPFSPSPSGLPLGIIFKEAGASRKRWATHSNPARTPAALKRQRLYRWGPGGETAASLPSARRSRWGQEISAHTSTAPGPRRPRQPPASPQPFPSKAPANPRGPLRLRGRNSADGSGSGLTGRPGRPRRPEALTLISLSLPSAQAA